jgi:hypothetical protein
VLLVLLWVNDEVTLVRTGVKVQRIQSRRIKHTKIFELKVESAELDALLVKTVYLLCSCSLEQIKSHAFDVILSHCGSQTVYSYSLELRKRIMTTEMTVTP